MEYKSEVLSLAKKRETTLLVTNYLKQNGKWSHIHKFLIEKGYNPEEDQEEEQKNKRVLVDQDTTTMAMLIYFHYGLGLEAHTVGSLARAMDGSSYNARKARERKIMRTLKAIAGYDIIDFYRDTHKGERNCIRIEATDLLLEFIENHFFNRT